MKTHRTRAPDTRYAHSKNAPYRRSWINIGGMLVGIRQIDRRRPNCLPLILLALSIIIANSLWLTGVFDGNPIDWLSSLAVASHPGLFPGQSTIDPSVGWITQALGHYAALSILHGHLPWWNPYEGLGAPLAGEMGSAALFPLTILQILPNGHLYFIMCLEFLAGLSTYFLVRRLTTSRWAAFAASVAFGVDGTFAWLSHAPINALAFLPMILLGVEMAADATRSHRKYGWVLIGVGLASAIYGGWPEEVYWFIPFVVAWVLLRFVQLARVGAGLQFLWKLGIAGATGVLLAAPLLIAFGVYFPHAVGPPHQPFDATAISPHAGLVTQVFPYLYGPIGAFTSFDQTNTLGNVWGASGGFLDTTLLILSFFGATGRTHRALRIFLAAFVLFNLGRLVGVGPIVHIVALLPGSWISFQRYAAPTWEIAVVLLAAFGMDDAIRSTVSRRRLWAGLVLGLAMVGLCYIEAHGVLHGMAKTPHLGLWIGISLAWGTGLIIAVIASIRFGKSLSAALLIFLVVLDAVALYAVPQLSSQRNVTNDYAAIEFLQTHLGDGRFFTLGPIAPNYGSYFQIQSINVIDIPIPKEWAHVVTTSLDPGLGGAFNFTGTDFWQTPGQPSTVNEFFSHISSYEELGTKYLVTPDNLVIDPSIISLFRLHAAFSDLLVHIYALPSPAPFYSASGQSECTILAPTISSATTVCKAPAVLTRRELNLPGWTASVNGQSRPVFGQGGMFEAVRVPAGASRVAFTFAPPDIDAGWLAFAAGMALLLLPAIGWRRRRSIAEHAWVTSADC